MVFCSGRLSHSDSGTLGDLGTAGDIGKGGCIGQLEAPMAPDLPPRLERRLKGPPGFNRAELPVLYGRISRFFQTHLLGDSPKPQVKAIE